MNKEETQEKMKELAGRILKKQLFDIYDAFCVDGRASLKLITKLFTDNLTAFAGTNPLGTLTVDIILEAVKLDVRGHLKAFEEFKRGGVSDEELINEAEEKFKREESSTSSGN